VKDAAKRVERHSQIWPVLDITGLIVMEALRGARTHHLDYWDAQIWATARLNQIHILFSEHSNDGKTLEGVQYVNPFSKSFRINNWV
jgi:predicted nucleic acid-binding protein